MIPTAREHPSNGWNKRFHPRYSNLHKLITAPETLLKQATGTLVITEQANKA